MKYIKILFIFILAFSSNNIYSQTDNGLKGIGIADDNDILLRWGYTDEESYLNMMQYGVKILRTEVTVEGLPVLDSTYATTVVLEEYITKYSETDLVNLAVTDEKYNVVKHLCYGINPTLKDGVTIRDLINYRDTINSRMFFSSVMADQDFEVAKSLGMGYVDITADTGRYYLYTIIIKDPDTTKSYLPGMVNVALNSEYMLQAPDKPTGEVGDSVVTISWDTEGLLNYYTFYDIERSADGAVFEKVNDAPFAFTPQEGYEGTKVFYKDSLPSNGVFYYYRVRGLSYFNIAAPVSEHVKVVGVPKRLQFQTRAPEFYIDGNDNAVLTTKIPSVHINDLAGYNVFRKDKANGVGVKLNGPLIPTTDTLYSDPNTQSVGYYYVELIDNNDHNYPSAYVMVQLNDTIPPAVPTNLTGYISDQGQVVLEWDMNTEEDFRGYKVFTSNYADTSSHGVYTEVTKSYIKESKYSYFIDTEFNAEDIYYKILAIDHRDNYSEKSASLLLKRPDHFPPSAPLLHRLVGSPLGVELGWVLSPDSDVAQHIVQRKEATASDWENILIIDQNNPVPPIPPEVPPESTTTWIDTNDSLKNVWYHYRVIALDEANNMSGSAFKKVKPYLSRIIDGKFGGMSAIRIGVNLLPPLSILKDILPDDVRITLEALEAAGGGGVNGDNSYMTKVFELYDIVLISWNYLVDENTGLESFKFYKSGSAFGVIDTSGVTTPLTQDDIDNYTYPFVVYKNVPETITTTLAQHYNYSGYMYIDIFKKPRNEQLNVDYTWKLMGMHDLGRYSPFSAELLLVSEGY